MTDFRALCAELVEELAAETSLYPGHERGIVTRARAALAEPEPIPVTERLPGPLVDSEVAELVEWLNDHAYVLNEHGARIVRRAVDLLKQLPPRPISVTKRLPGPEDGDAEGKCWCWCPPTYAGLCGCWTFAPLKWAEEATHWLPADVIPAPRSENV